MTQLVEQDFPQRQAKVESLVKRHLEIKDEPLLLAVYFSPGREPQDVFVLEVIEYFGADSVNPDRELFEISYASQTPFPLNPGQGLHLLLTNPVELKEALREEWPSLREVRDAVRQGRYRVLHQDPKAAALMEAIRG